MILDVLENSRSYLTMNKGFAAAFDFLARPDLASLQPDTYEIDGDRVYAMVIKDVGRKRQDALLEAHEEYIDIQLVLAGTDEMGWKPKALCRQPTGDYMPDKDTQLFADEPDAWLSTKQGAFAIFLPEDAHMPMISSGELHKIIVKVAMD